MHLAIDSARIMPDGMDERFIQITNRPGKSRRASFIIISRSLTKMLGFLHSIVPSMGIERPEILNMYHMSSFLGRALCPSWWNEHRQAQKKLKADQR
jgi:hypothetical protein